MRGNGNGEVVEQLCSHFTWIRALEEEEEEVEEVGEEVADGSTSFIQLDLMRQVAS